MAFRRPVRIDMTPMVDVAFLLLIFFMSTTQFRPPEPIAVQLPLSTSEIHIPDTDTIIITVNEDGLIYISSEAGFDAMEVPEEALFQAIVDWRSRNPSSVVVIKGDRNASFGAIADLMDVLAETKTLRFNLMTDLKRKPPEDDRGR
jgi:biopolymer transport protein ExbD